MYFNFLAQLSAAVMYGAQFVIDMIISVKYNQGEEQASCQYILAERFIYMGATTTNLFRVGATCYMNLKFSRPFDECKE